MKRLFFTHAVALLILLSGCVTGRAPASLWGQYFFDDANVLHHNDQGNEDRLPGRAKLNVDTAPQMHWIPRLDDQDMDGLDMTLSTTGTYSVQFAQKGPTDLAYCATTFVVSFTDGTQSQLRANDPQRPCAQATVFSSSDSLPMADDFGFASVSSDGDSMTSNIIDLNVKQYAICGDHELCFAIVAKDPINPGSITSVGSVKLTGMPVNFDFRVNGALRVGTSSAMLPLDGIDYDSFTGKISLVLGYAQSPLTGVLQESKVGVQGGRGVWTGKFVPDSAPAASFPFAVLLGERTPIGTVKIYKGASIPWGGETITGL